MVYLINVNVEWIDALNENSLWFYIVSIAFYVIYFFAKTFVWQVDSRKKFYSKFFESGQIIANWKFRAVIFASQQLTT